MKTARLAFALLVSLTFASALPAAAKLTPLQQLPFDQVDVTSLHTGPAAASVERNYFHAPQLPVASRRVSPCTVQMLLFDKARLAQACY